MTAAPLIEGHFVDGYLVDAYREDIGNGRFWIVGTIYHDRKGRFEDGSIIHTSAVARLIECRAIPRFAHAADAITANSRYRIINWREPVSPEEPQMSKPRYTKEIALPDHAKATVRVEPDSNKLVKLDFSDVEHQLLLDPATAVALGRTLMHAARLAALNTVLEGTPAFDPIRGGELQ